MPRINVDLFFSAQKAAALDTFAAPHPPSYFLIMLTNILPHKHRGLRMILDELNRKCNFLLVHCF